MKRPLLLVGTLLPLITSAATIDRATLTEVVNSVSIIDRGTKKTSSAKSQQVFDAPNVLRTGPDSRAEMIAADQTVTRVGQNTLFSFQQDSREINLDKGSILFQSPSGKGGGTIRTSAASAAVLGTTLIVTSTKNGGFKVLVLEGNGRVKGAGGTRTLSAGQLVYAMPGGRISAPFTFQLREQTGVSKLVRGFKRPLPSLGKIASAIAAQEKEIASGKVKATGLLASGSPDFAFQFDVARDAQKPNDSAMNGGASPFVAAVSSDAVVVAPTLDPARLFGPDFNTNEFASPPILLGDDGGDVQGPQLAASPAVFLGNNISFETPSVDLGQFAGRDLVQFFATSDVALTKSMEFSSFPGQLFISAGGTITNTPGITVSASSEVLAILAFGNGTPMTDMPRGEVDVRFEKTLSLERLNLLNRTGALVIAGGNMDLRALQAGAPGGIEINTSGTLKIDRATDKPDFGLFQLFNGNGALPNGYSNFVSDSAIKIAGSGDGTIRNASIRAPQIVINQQNLTLERVRISDGSSFNPNVTPPPMPGAARVRLNATNLLTLSGVKMTANDVYMQARTISLADMNFRDGSRIWLESALGVLARNPNRNAPVAPGRVNFVRNVRYDGNLITSPNDPVILQNGAPSSGGGSPQGPGIVIRPLGSRNVTNTPQ